ncbi:16S rRNA processing protein RimM family [Wolffia australiana]
MLLSNSLLRPWRNSVATASRRRLSRTETPASSSSTVLLQPWKHVRLGGRSASSHFTRHGSVPGVEADQLQEEETLEEEDNDAQTSRFVEVGYISSVHGLQGEVRVRSSTAFPEVRFAEPGVRWLRTRVSGSDEVRPVELTSGRCHSGPDSWILTFDGVGTVDEARQLIGSTILVEEDDRPDLEEGEFYTPDLYGMKVILKESGQEVGTVVNVVNYGSSDLLQVKLTESIGSSVVWVPFVEAIVPDVDIDKREMLITPPKGLLELNVRSDTRSKKERRLMGWKERKKVQQNFTFAKKRLAEMGQDHVLRGLASGEKDEKKLLGKQMGDLNMRLFKHALENIIENTESNNHFSSLDANFYHSAKICREIPESCYNPSSCEESKDIQQLKSDGLRVLSENNVAAILIPNVQKNESRFLSLLRDALSSYQKIAKPGEIESSPPLIILSPVQDLEPDQDILSNFDDGGFDKERVWVFEEEKLPVLNKAESDFKILMKSPWEIIVSPAGPGALFSPLSSRRIFDRLNELGVRYVQISSLGQRCTLADPLFLGFIDSQKVNVGIKIFADGDRERDIDLIFSLEYLNKLAKQEVKLPRFHAVPRMNKHIVFNGDDWISVDPTEPNSYQLHCPIHEILRSLSADDVAILKIID